MRSLQLYSIDSSATDTPYVALDASFAGHIAEGRRGAREVATLELTAVVGQLSVDSKEPQAHLTRSYQKLERGGFELESSQEKWEMMGS